jgi:anti-sigma factor RsiW
MNCREMADFLMAYLDGELPEAQRLKFEQHMAICPPCVAYLAGYKRTIDLGKEACTEPEGRIPDDVPEQLIQAIIAARSKRRR